MKPDLIDAVGFAGFVLFGAGAWWQFGPTAALIVAGVSLLAIALLWSYGSKEG